MPDPRSVSIRCLGCHREFGSFDAYGQHKTEVDHPDEGEVYVR